MSGLLFRFLISLVLTLCIEVMLAAMCRIRGKDIWLVVLVNCLTNPAAVLLSVLTGDRRSIQFLIEAVVILTEGWYYKKYGEAIRHPVWLAVICNVSSYGLGLILNHIF